MVLAGVMALSMMPGPIIGIFARYFIDELGLSRTEIGAVATFQALLIMAVSIPFGRLADRIGGRNHLILMLAFFIAGMVSMSVSWDFWSLLLFAAIAGLPAAGANSATNTIIVDNVRSGSRGWITGFKQSGVQVGLLFAGLALPFIAELLGWRQALALTTLLAGAVIALALGVVPRPVPLHPEAAPTSPEQSGKLPPAVRWLSVYGVTMGVGVGAYSAFAPLFAQETLGMSVTLSGVVIAVSGGSGTLSRVVWGRIAEQAAHPSVPLIVIGTIAFAALTAIWVAPYTTPLLIWVGAILIGVSLGSWMSVGMMGAIMLSGPRRTGEGTGLIMLGFGLGLTIGPVLFGWGVDTFGNYHLSWAGVIINCVAAVGMMLVWRLKTRREVGQVTSGKGSAT